MPGYNVGDTVHIEWEVCGYDRYTVSLKDKYGDTVSFTPRFLDRSIIKVIPKPREFQKGDKVSIKYSPNNSYFSKAIYDVMAVIPDMPDYMIIRLQEHSKDTSCFIVAKDNYKHADDKEPAK
jgi:ribosomal protein L21E